MNVLAEITKAGLLTTVQDLGRKGSRHLGVPLAGGADPFSLALANAALGNAPGAAALECTLQGPSLRFLAPTTIALAGANMDAALNGAAIPLYEAASVKEGDELVLGAAKTGARCYIAVAGGLAGEDFLGSVSTYAPAALGGLEGRALKPGDRLRSGGGKTSAAREIPAALRPRFTSEFFLRATKGPETHELSPDSLKQFFSARWTVSRRAGRMGLQLEGPSLSLIETPSQTTTMASSPVFPGTVQCPPDGAPFLLSCDAQTVGGYPRIAQLIAADLPLAGQMRAGDHLWLRRTGEEEACDIAQKKAALLADIFPCGFFR
ncbi:biotin-dependent carboxyltransferase family protein [Hyphococcus luteus]|uniref:KipI antagonist n=1 Tax=Hyphococcus luteus TaxID=2058213 RepID=A0A2S7K647_9PROT|nr:biotin-dependent carboxyltransferase family protein [Marinicaulis flavus]PQA87962.1 KipI antagonist [Marinicaulis flavus]